MTRSHNLSIRAPSCGLTIVRYIINSSLLLLFTELQVIPDIEESLNGDRRSLERLLVSLRYVLNLWFKREGLYFFV
jgi:hypothetical protein